MMDTKNLLPTYALLVCLVTTLIMIVSAALSINYITNLTIPTYKYYFFLQKYDSNEKYIKSLTTTRADGTEVIPSTLTNLSDTQITAKRLQERVSYLKEKQVDNFMDLLSSSQWFLVALLFFWIHWRFYRSKACCPKS